MAPLIYSLAAVLVLTFAFEAALGGTDLIQASYPAFRTVDFGSCDSANSGFGFGAIPCYFANGGAFVLNLLIFLFGTIALLINLASFNVAGAPPLVRAILGGTVGLTFIVMVLLVARSGSPEG